MLQPQIHDVERHQAKPAQDRKDGRPNRLRFRPVRMTAMLAMNMPRVIVVMMIVDMVMPMIVVSVIMMRMSRTRVSGTM